MAKYEGVPYVWGGETRFGMDCSGLVRKGFQNALLKRGLLTLNPSLIRSAMDLWWNDTTASEIGRGYGGRTIPVTNCSSLNTLAGSLLLPGDMAVTTTGIHVMAYLGNNTWIGADPGEMRVAIFAVPEMKNAWFSSPMNIVRWKMLKD
jgi:cell wall-associated NlpC family hydrolase